MNPSNPLSTRAKTDSRTLIDILLVEDHEPIRTVLTAALTQRGYILRSAVNGRKAMTFMKQHVYRLLITDIYMPEMDGFEVIMTHNLTSPKVPVLAMTGGCHHTLPEENLKMARILGSNATISKPFSIEEFLAAVHALLPTPSGESSSMYQG